MFLAGDEFANTQFGNNNAYCQDNIISWLDWTLLEKNKGIFDYFQYMIRFRKEHRVLRTNVSNGACGLPDVSFHGVEPWQEQFEDYDRYVGVLFAGWERDTGPQVIYVASNAYWEELRVNLPELPASMCWELIADTFEEELLPVRKLSGSIFTIRPRSVMVFVGR